MYLLQHFYYVHYSLTHLFPVHLFSTPWKHLYSGGTERVHWERMGWNILKFKKTKFAKLHLAQLLHGMYSVCVDEVNRKSENHVFCLNIGADVRGSWLLIIIILSMNLRSINSPKFGTFRSNWFNIFSIFDISIVVAPRLISTFSEH